MRGYGRLMYVGISVSELQTQVPGMMDWVCGYEIRLIITYAQLALWTSMKYKCNIMVEHRVQRTCCLDMTGAFKTTIVHRTTVKAASDRRRTANLLRLSKPEISRFVGVITGLTALLAHLHRVGIVSDDRCKACWERSEILKHYLFQCLTFFQIRSWHFGTDTLPLITHLVGTSCRRKQEFVVDTEFPQTHGSMVNQYL